MISIHAPAWGATKLVVSSIIVPSISIHAPAWGATSGFIKFPAASTISIHAPAWGATRGTAHIAHPHPISIHAPAWGATVNTIVRALIPIFISIHAPAWGATNMTRFGHYYARISIHAPAWGATTPVISKIYIYQDFNPRTRVGCDILDSGWPVAFDNFNPRTRVGCDKPPLRKLSAWHSFQSTHPRGVRQKRGAGSVYKRYISIHAPAWGATAQTGVGRYFKNISIHAPAWGATPAFYTFRQCLWYFNPRTRVGCDYNGRDSSGGDIVISIHAPAWGATWTFWFFGPIT